MYACNDRITSIIVEQTVIFMAISGGFSLNNIDVGLLKIIFIIL